jgi:hypothetical protein
VLPKTSRKRPSIIDWPPIKEMQTRKKDWSDCPLRLSHTADDPISDVNLRFSFFCWPQSSFELNVIPIDGFIFSPFVIGVPVNVSPQNPFDATFWEGGSTATFQCFCINLQNNE